MLFRWSKKHLDYTPDASVVEFTTIDSGTMYVDFNFRIQWLGEDLRLYANTRRNYKLTSLESEERGRYPMLAYKLAKRLLVQTPRCCTESLKIKPYGLEILHSRAVSNAWLKEIIEKVIRQAEADNNLINP